jgi:hypothetical protein
MHRKTNVLAHQFTLTALHMSQIQEVKYEPAELLNVKAKTD